MNDSESLKRIHMYKNKRIIYTYSTLIQRKEECKQQYADFFFIIWGWVGHEIHAEGPSYIL